MFHQRQQPDLLSVQYEVLCDARAAESGASQSGRRNEQVVFMMEVLVRSESSRDFEAIRSVIELAFEDMPFAEGDEADLVESLREQGALSVSLVAELDEKVVGQIALSPASSGDASRKWYALGPVSVLPELQGRGIGAMLVRAGLHEIETLGADGCILTGDPDYYVRFGFEVSPECAPSEEPAEYFMVKVFKGENPGAPISFHAAFHVAR